QEAMDAQRAFLKEHVLRWVPTWATHVAQHAQTDFYRGCALMTRGLFQVLAVALGVASPPRSFRTGRSPRRARRTLYWEKTLLAPEGRIGRWVAQWQYEPGPTRPRGDWQTTQ